MSDLAEYIKTLSDSELKRIIPKLTEDEYSKVKHTLKLGGKEDSLEKQKLMEKEHPILNFPATLNKMTGGVLGVTPKSEIMERSLNRIKEGKGIVPGIKEEASVMGKNAVKTGANLAQLIPGTKLATSAIAGVAEGTKSYIEGNRGKQVMKDAGVSALTNLAVGAGIEGLGVLGAYGVNKLGDKLAKVAKPAIESEEAKKTISIIDKAQLFMREKISKMGLAKAVEDQAIANANAPVLDKINLLKISKEKKNSLYNKKIGKLTESADELASNQGAVLSAINDQAKNLEVRNESVKKIKQIPGISRYIQDNKIKPDDIIGHLDAIEKYSKDVIESGSDKLAVNLSRTVIPELNSNFTKVYNKMFDSVPEGLLVDVTDEFKALNGLLNQSINPATGESIPFIASKSNMLKIISDLKQKTGASSEGMSKEVDQLVNKIEDNQTGQLLIPPKYVHWLKQATYDAGRAMGEKASDSGARNELNTIARSFRAKTADAIPGYEDVTKRYAEFKGGEELIDRALGKIEKSSSTGAYRLGLTTGLEKMSKDIADIGGELGESSIRRIKTLDGVMKNVQLLESNGMVKEAREIKHSVGRMARRQLNLKTISSVKAELDNLIKGALPDERGAIEMVAKDVSDELHLLNRGLEEQLQSISSKKFGLSSLKEKSLTRIDSEISDLTKKIVSADRLGDNVVKKNLAHKMVKLTAKKDALAEKILPDVPFKGKDFIYMSMSLVGSGLGIPGMKVAGNLLLAANLAKMLTSQKPIMASSTLKFLNAMKRRATRLPAKEANQVLKAISVQEALIISRKNQTQDEQQIRNQ